VNSDTAELDDRDRAGLARLVAGNSAALNELMQRHGGKLLNYLLRSLQSEEDAADLAQEVFVRVYQNCSRFDPRQKFSTWLYTIATNLLKDRYRYRSRHPQVSLEAENEASGGDFRESISEQRPTPSESMQAAERAEAVRKAVGRLPEELRVPLILFEYEELSHAEISGILDCSVKAVETRLYRARQQLRTALASFMEKG
jgi:RNA polymerase sigma-70 factor (ECF subfamily)